MSTHCYIYRCGAKQDMYIYLAEKDDFDTIDDNLRKTLGELSFSMVLELKNDSQLAKEDPVKVIANLQSQKFHLQLPPAISIEELMEKIAQ